MPDAIEAVFHLINSYPAWAKIVVLLSIALSTAVLVFAPRTDGRTADSQGTTKDNEVQEQVASGIANVLKEYQDDTTYRQWRAKYKSELFAGLDVLPTDQAVGMLAHRIDSLLVDFNAEIAGIDARLQAPPSEGDKNGVFRVIEAYAKKNKERIKGSLLDARQMIRNQAATGVHSRELLIQLQSILQ